ncbi:serine hydrolase-domain-containing protein [Aspergillus keveii]|uniref:Serine hydrolase-domain-containing protein n=1 Tax=Aspergillus keveii TaxID=714993 RepID=A0ABR4G6C0_9EURO
MLETLQPWAPWPQALNPWMKTPSLPSTFSSTSTSTSSSAYPTPIHTPQIRQHSQYSYFPSPPSQKPTPKDPSLSLPRILCLHGGGTNARIFRSQCRALRARLGPYFRLVFADAPFFTTPGPDVISVYEKWGPFRAWFPPGYGMSGSPHNGPVPICDTDSASHLVISSIESSITAAMNADNALGASGPFIGLLGFSQGAKMAASLLLRQQNNPGHGYDSQIDYRFAVLLAGRAPMVSLSPDDDMAYYGLVPATLTLPTIHVHGTKDPGLPLHRELLEYGCEEGSARVVEWEGEHRVPIRSGDVLAVVEEVLGVAREVGVLRY